MYNSKVATHLRSIFFGACLMGSSALIVSCGGDANSKMNSEEKQEDPLVPVEVAKVVRGDIFASYSNTAALEAEGEATVVAKVSEIITNILVEEGDQVKAGQVLAELDSEKLALQVAQSEAQLQRLEKELQRNKEMHQKQLISSDTFEKLKFDYQAQKAAYDLSKLSLTYSKVRAPIDGVISRRMVKVGNMVNVNDPLFHISDFDPLHAILHVPESQLGKLKQGQSAKIKVDAYKDTVFTGKIKRISPIVDADSGTFRVTIEVRDKEQRLKPGMFGRVQVIYDQHLDTLLIDRNSIVTDIDQPVVYIIKDGVAHRTPIKTGFVNDEFIEVVEGVDGDATIVTAGQNSLKNKSKVEVLN